jgi:hypothetical protein
MSREDYADKDDHFLRDDYAEGADFSRRATRREVAELRTLVHSLERQLDREAVILSALCEILGPALGESPQALLDRVRRAILERPDAREKKCPRCHQPVPVRSPRCIYCGADRAVESLADLLWVVK